MSPTNGAPRPANAKADCEKLIAAFLPFAQDILAKHGEFYPFGGYMKPSGEIVSVGARIDDTEIPRPADLLQFLRDSFSESAKAGECRAIAILAVVRVTPPETDKNVDAIHVNLEHINGYCVEVFFPYETEDQRVTLGTPFAQKGQRLIFE